MQTQSIKSIKKLGIQNTLDFEVNHKDHNFYAEGVLVSNSHSLGVSYLGALTVWAKYKYPLQFYTACLNSAKNQPSPTDEIAAIEKELQFFGIKLLAPDIIKSKNDFIMEDGNIRFSIQSIKGIADKTLQKMQNFKHDDSTKFGIFNSASEAKLGIGVLSALIQSGCLSSYCQDIPRSLLVLEAQLYNLLTPKEKKRVMDIGANFNYGLIDILKNLSKVQTGAAKPFIKESRMETIRKAFKDYQKIYNLNSRNEKLACWYYEQILLGYSYSSQLFDILKEEYVDLVDLYEIKGYSKDTRVQIGGKLTEARYSISKKGKPQFMGIINDSTDEFKVRIGENQLDMNNELNNGIPLKIGDIVVCEGRHGGDIIWADRIVSQNIKIFTKLSELKNSGKIVEREK